MNLQQLNSSLTKTQIEEHTFLDKKRKRTVIRTDPTKTVECSFCGKKVGKHYHRTHLRIHSANSHYYCDFCGYKTTDDTNRNKHERAHVTGKPFQCKNCYQQFITPRSIRHHLLRVHHIPTSLLPSVDALLREVLEENDNAIKTLTGGLPLLFKYDPYKMSVFNGNSCSATPPPPPPVPPANVTVDYNANFLFDTSSNMESSPSCYYNQSFDTIYQNSLPPFSFDHEFSVHSLS
ncbi:DgyrCDS10801 [Dimorphilus gyrociliatus]|uniref:DgyrCDS10801 n=1 Tax=Dimorphilus gyrociliatus TaxID=2664684 RepID=A0A7I8W1D0_9ANNE|nr:DgyrCDS10801 [Dimorphilus gyrociliatus]